MHVGQKIHYSFVTTQERIDLYFHQNYNYIFIRRHFFNEQKFSKYINTMPNNSNLFIISQLRKKKILYEKEIWKLKKKSITSKLRDKPFCVWERRKKRFAV